LIELLDHLGRLGAQAAADLVVAPACLDLILDLVDRAFARRRDAENVEPDIAAAELDRIVVDADVAGEGLRDDVEALRNAGNRLPVRRADRSTASMVTEFSPSFWAASITLAPPPRSSSILS
jgi:hypothetical protein